MAPVGRVENEVQESMSQGWEDVTSEIVINPELEECMEGIEQYTHITVVYWMDRVSEEDRRVQRVHPRGREELPLRGVFATRSPYRPNPLGLTTVSLLARDGNRLRVRGLDALNGTPVVDIKPYTDCDRPRGSEVPARAE
jgi:tRNA-Thr(GGU) m(6)t(6)A37 methyltransferase TsaA